MRASVILAAALALIGTHIGAALWAYGAGQDVEIARQARADQGAQKGAGHAVAEAKAESVKTITKVRTIVREVPVYRDADCSHDDRVHDALNRALSGAGDGGMPE